VKKYPHGFYEDGKNKYSVDELFDIVRGREPKNISIRKIIEKNKDLETKEGNFFDNIENPSKEFKGRAEKSDENYPILLSREGWIIDGSHRVAKLKWLGRRKISAHILSKKDLETAIVNIDESIIFGFEMWKKLTPI